MGAVDDASSDLKDPTSAAGFAHERLAQGSQACCKGGSADGALADSYNSTIEHSALILVPPDLSNCPPADPCHHCHASTRQLLDIPGLSQRWYTLNGTPVPDPASNLALSAVGLAANLLANALLIFRFSSREKWWKTAMMSSTVAWNVKSVIAIVNLGLYGAGSRNGPGYEYSDGFWCAVFSCLIAGFISVFLLFSALLLDEEHTQDSDDIRVQARHFLMTELAFFLFLALEALSISKLEDWEFFEGVYFAMVTATTVGFGSDYAPTTVASKILVFPFAVITIAGLGAQVSSLLDFFSSRAQARKRRWRARYEAAKIEGDDSPTDELVVEMQYLDKIIKEEDRLSRIYDLISSSLIFSIFWIVGAVIFAYLEDWTVGNGLYFCYVFFLTIGYGDFYPHSSCGRVFWVVYALGAVPIVASFVVQTISGIMSAIQQKRLQQARIKRGIELKLERTTTIPVSKSEKRDPAAREELGEEGEAEEISPFISHNDLVIRWHEHFRVPRSKHSIPGEESEPLELGQPDSSIDQHESLEGTIALNDLKAMSASERLRIARSINNSGGQSPTGKVSFADNTDGEGLGYKEDENSPDSARAARQKVGGDSEASQTIEQMMDMLDELVMHSLNLERVARRLMIAKLPSGSKGRLLLQADANLMQRAVDFYSSEDAEAEITSRNQTDPGTDGSDLEQIHIYRESFARILVASTRLKRLEGREQLKFERRRGLPYKYGYPVKADDQATT